MGIDSFVSYKQGLTSKFDNWKINIFAISLGLFLPNQLAFAGPPIPFGSTSCPTGFTCENNVVSTGMLQRILSKSDGTSYIQVTLQDGVVNNGGRITYDSFINSSNGNTLGGISAKLDINQTGAENMDYTTILNLGWANTSGTGIELFHNITDSYQGVGLDYTFGYLQNQNSKGTATGYYYDLFQRVTNSSKLNGSNSGGEDIHTFVIRRAAGNFVKSGSITLPGSNDGAMGTTGGGGGGGGGGGMRKSTVSGGSSTGSSVNMQKAFVPLAQGYGTNGGSSGTVGDPQTEPPAATVYGPDSEITSMFPDTYLAWRSNITNTLSVNMYDTNNYVYTQGSSTGSIISDGNASGPPAPTSEINVATGDPMGGGMGGGPPGGSVSWNTGHEVQVIWIGQSCPGCAVSMGGGGMGGTANAGLFSFQQYDNLTTGASVASRTITDSAPLVWTTSPFGPQPGL